MPNAFYKSLWLALLCVGQAAATWAQPGVVNGWVHHGAANLPAATVSIGAHTWLTNQEGAFTLSLPAGQYQLLISYAGYQKKEVGLTVIPGSTQHIEISLVPVDQLGEIVVVGSRSTSEQSNLYTPAPVDVFSAARLAQTGQVSLTQMLTFSEPSLNASRELLNEPVTLRGLDPQHVLILLNGTRYHNMAWFFGGGLKGQLGRGSVGNDLNSIPFSAIDKVEVLRDGAAALYGSDAVAGVMNIRLKETTGKTNIRLHTGQYYKGDGEKFSFGLYRGFALHNKGFISLSSDLRYQNPTLRGGEYKGTIYKKYPPGVIQNDSIKAIDDSMVTARNFNRKQVIDNVGNLKIVRAGMLLNSRYDIAFHTRLWATAAINQRTVWRKAGYRFPKNENQVNLALFPDGFQPLATGTTRDITGMAGIKGFTKKDWHWELTSSYGTNQAGYHIKNSNNASQYTMGKEAPTSFYAGKSVYQLWTHNMNMVKRYTGLPVAVKSLNVAFGGEERLESYRTTAGEEASWKNYDTTGSKQGGSQGSAGTRPEDVVHKSRNVWGLYLDIEATVTDRFLFDIAGRYEYYNDFGGNLAGKLAARYRLSERWMVRASVNNGFRAPSLQQQYTNTTQPGYVRVANTILTPAVGGLFSNDHVVAKALGIPPLTAERTINISGGLTAKPAAHVSLAVDAYWIQIKNRTILSGDLNRSTNPTLDSVLSRYPDLNHIDLVAFFSNAINTRTYGVDVVCNGYYQWATSYLSYTFAANLNRTHVYGTIQTPHNLPRNELNTNSLFDRAYQSSIEQGQPGSKLLCSIAYQKEKAGITITNTRFGKTAVYHETSPALDEYFSPKLLTDISLHYTPSSWLTITLGANNVFNVYPDRLQHSENTNHGLLIYSPEAAPFGFNGGYYFISLGFDW